MRRARLVHTESTTRRAVASVLTLSLLAGGLVAALTYEPAPAVEAAGPGELIPPLNIERRPPAELEVNARVLDDTLNHWQVEANLEAVRRWEAELARQAELERQRKAKLAAAKAARSSSSGGAGGNLAARRACEAGGDYGAVSSSGKYRGGYQFDQSSWNSAARHAGRPDLVGVDPAKASPADQDALARVWERVHGGDPWPNCP